MSSANAIAEAMECTRGGCKCHATASKGYGKTHCPVHGDGDPSLNVSERNQTTLWYCHAGCEQDAVTAALRERGLVHEVRDHRGQIQAYHVRKGPWVKPDGTVGLNGAKPADMLFGLETLTERPNAPVVVVEGEKAAGALQRTLGGGTVVLGTVGGASSTPTSEVLGHLQGRRVFLWPDNDEPGRKHMARIGGELTATGVAKLHLVDWPDAPEKGDAADFCTDHDTAAAIALIKAAQPWKPNLQPIEHPVGGCLLEAGGDELASSTKTVADLPYLPLLGGTGYLVRGWSHLVAGYPRVGKTDLLVAAVKEWLDAGLKVLYITEEPRSIWEFRLAGLARQPNLQPRTSRWRLGSARSAQPPTHRTARWRLGGTSRGLWTRSRARRPSPARPRGFRGNRDCGRSTQSVAPSGRTG